uniref:Uncharacterized protein n=1 Tax=Anguilla anguilla TaxID=7936 RepID=A0A0E9S0B9_ANGAN
MSISEDCSICDMYSISHSGSLELCIDQKFQSNPTYACILFSSSPTQV